MTFDSKALFFIAATASEISTGGQKYAKGLPSPCMSVCRMDEASGLCCGCLRTLAEIRAWGQADEAFKRQVWSTIEARVAPRLQAADELFDSTP
ncbi:MAG: putative Fe-S protein [Comamonadaceae bacterium]|nr:MAG: putative Fe-S protein [Comamonadaceae bacterium]